MHRVNNSPGGEGKTYVNRMSVSKYKYECSGLQHAEETPEVLLVVLQDRRLVQERPNQNGQEVTGAGQEGGFPLILQQTQNTQGVKSLVVVVALVLVQLIGATSVPHL